MHDEEFLEAFRADPEQALEDYDLSKEEKQVLESRIEGDVRDQVDEHRADTVFTI